MTAAITSTSPNTEPERLSVHRLQRLDGVAFAGTLLTGIAALFAALVVLHWQPDLYLPVSTQTGLRWLLMAFAHLYILARLVEGTWDRTHGYTRLAGGQTGPIPVAPLHIKLYALLLSAPLWPTIISAWQGNDAAVLLTADVGQRALLLPLPLLVFAVSSAAIETSARIRDRLERQQVDENDTTGKVVR